jgi:spermidine synthase
MITLERRETAYGTITIYRRKLTGAVVYYQGSYCQSEADPAGVSCATYIHALFDLLQQNEASDVLMIGCGGGTLGTMLARVSRRVTVVDVNGDAFDLARRYFALPPDVCCEVGDGRNYLLSHAKQYDAIVLDAFQADEIPQHLRSPGFLRLAAKRLRPRGMFLVNVHVQDDLDPTPDQVARAVAAAWQEVRLLDLPGHPERNAIVAAGNVLRLRLPTLRLAPSTSVNEIIQELNLMRFRPWH